MLTVRKVSKTEFSAVRTLSRNTIKRMQSASHPPVYPSDAALCTRLRAGELYIGPAQKRNRRSDGLTHARTGYARRMVQSAIPLARQASAAGRTPHGNLPALWLYASLGFRYVETLPLFCEDTGRTDFLLCEYTL